MSPSHYGRETRKTKISPARAARRSNNPWWETTRLFRSNIPVPYCPLTDDRNPGHTAMRWWRTLW